MEGLRHGTRGGDAASVAVAALTYDRPVGLARLLAGLRRQAEGPGRVAAIVIVDNHPGASARGLVESLSVDFPFPLAYVQEPRPGVVHARNRALEEAGRLGADRIAFIDDDEEPHDDWLRSLMQGMDSTGAAAVIGRVKPAYEAPAPAWMVRGGFHDHGRGFPEGSRPPHCFVGNSLIDLHFVREHGLSFDPHFSCTGGEDTDLFDRIAQAGGILRFRHDAVVEETITSERASLGWLWRRWRRTGNSDALLRLHRAPGGATRARLLLGGLARICIAGAAATGTLPLAVIGRGDVPAEHLRKVARGCGFVAAALGRAQTEYASGARGENAATRGGRP